VLKGSGSASLVLVPWYSELGTCDLDFGIWNFAKVAAQPQTTTPDPFWIAPEKLTADGGS
jgi:hypothetical protein